MEEKIHSFIILAYKESPYLEDCIQSVLKQKDSSEVAIATSTPNAFIDKLAEQYQLNVLVNPNANRGIGFDFDFAVSCGKTQLVTVAHQDDIYEEAYASSMVAAYKNNSDAIILFSDYYEIRDHCKVFTNLNLKIKRILMTFVKMHCLSKTRIGKRSCLAFGNAICCPAVTFVKPNIAYEDIFACDMKCDIDWYAWERLSREKGRFVYLKGCLMGHRVHEESTTTEIISDQIRTREDFIMFKKFWPAWIAKLLNRFYVKSENSNQVQ